ncbi:Alkaline phosphatase synthesis sensor protein PhoR [compost metagenome]
MPKITQEEMEHKWDYKEQVSLYSEYASVSAPIYGGNSGKEIGRTVLMQSDESLTTTKSVVIVVVIMLIIFTLSGLLTIYLLASRLSLPLRQLTIAAKKIRKGNYSIGELRVQTQEKEISELVDSFSEMAARLKQLEEWRILSLAGVSHELKTPVTSIKGLIHAVKDEVVTGEEAEEFLDLALKETSRLDRMVADLLDYNAFAAGNVSLRSDRLELKTLLNEVVHQWKLMDNHHDIDCVLTLPEDETYVVGDALRIRQIIVNLLNNSIQAKHHERKLVIGITIDLSDPDKVMIKIKDNGIGVSQEDVPNIFERFYRGERKTIRPHGLGLGLTYSQQLAQAQGGNLTLRSSSKEGTVFAITFPIA